MRLILPILSLVLVAGVLSAGPAPVAAQTHYLEITIPLQAGLNPALRSPVATYEWQTVAGSPDPAEVRWIMAPADGNDFAGALDYIRNNPDAPEWSAWTAYSPPGTGTSWTSPPIAYGPYVFAVQGRDASGIPETEFDESRNARRVRVSNRLTGPVFTVDGTLIDPIVTAITTTPPVEIDIPSDTPITFCWSADASEYGGIVTGYRYGWDVVDPDDDNDPGWVSDFVAFGQETECAIGQEFFVGVHTFTVEVIDNDGYKSRVVIVMTVLDPVDVAPRTWGALKSGYR